MATPACREILGTAFDFVGCPVTPQFLGCIPAEMPCDLAITTVCREGGKLVLQLKSGQQIPVSRNHRAKVDARFPPVPGLKADAQRGAA